MTCDGDDLDLDLPSVSDDSFDFDWLDEEDSSAARRTDGGSSLDRSVFTLAFSSLAFGLALRRTIERGRRPKSAQSAPDTPEALLADRPPPGRTEDDRP